MICADRVGAVGARPIRIGLLWHSLTSDNLGVGALTIAQMALVDRVAAPLGLEPRFTVLGWVEPKEPYVSRPGLEIRGFRMKDFVAPRDGFVGAARRCDLVLDIGAGDSFADIYGAARILKMLTAQRLVGLAGRSLVMSPQTIGPFRRPWIRRLALGAMRRARAVAVRDELSAGFAREMGYLGELVEATDVALALPFDPPPARPPDAPVRVGLNVSGLLWNGGYSRDNMFGLRADYPALVRRLAEHVQTSGAELHLISHVTSASHAVEDDGSAAGALAEELPRPPVIAPVFSGPSQAKTYIAGMDFFVGARMHACIAAFSTGVPVVPMAYSRKFAGLFGTLGYPHVADCTVEDEDAIFTRVSTAFAGRHQLAREVAAARDRGLERLGAYESLLATVLAETASRSVPRAKAGRGAGVR